MMVGRAGTRLGRHFVWLHACCFVYWSPLCMRKTRPCPTCQCEGVTLVDGMIRGDDLDYDYGCMHVLIHVRMYVCMYVWPC